MSHITVLNGNHTHPKRQKVLIADAIDKCGVEILKTVADVVINTNLKLDELCKIIGEFDGLVVRSGTSVTEEVIRCGVKLKIIGRAGVGVDNIDVGAATRNGIYVVSSPTGNTVAAAEHTIALMLALARNIPRGDASLRNGKWNRGELMGVQLSHKTIGIIGLGQVGSYVASIARSFHMKVIGYDPFVNEEKAKSIGCQLCNLQELLSQSDFITLHVPLIDETKYLIREETIAMMKPGARLVNASRGGVVNEVDLCRALLEGKLAGAALDVFEVEGVLNQDHPLLKPPNLILTPHLGASTREAQKNVATDVAEQIKDLFCSRIPLYAVNVPGITSSELKVLHPLLTACETLGRIAAQLLHGRLECLKVVLQGVYVKQQAEPLVLSAANGVLSCYSSERVNFVNVKQKVAENKISILSESGWEGNPSSILIEVSNKMSSTSIAGSLVDNNLEIHQFKGIPIHVVIPSPIKSPQYMLYSKHSDLPGTLGLIASALGDNDVNVANCHLGRTHEDGEYYGICLFCIDEKVEQKVVRIIEALPRVKECRQFIV